MDNTYGRNLKVEILGESHGEKIEMKMSGFPNGFTIDLNKLNGFIARRKPKEYDTLRVEEDNVIFDSGVEIIDDRYVKVVGDIICHVDNKAYDDKEYEDFSFIPRPSTSDFTSFMKDGVILPGSGRFSGRLTIGFVVLGGICKQYLQNLGIDINARLAEVGGVKDISLFDDKIEEAYNDGDSLGGVVKLEVTGIKPGEIGDNLFLGLESRLSEIFFAIPGVKGVTFGSGFKGARLKGSQNNDSFAFDSDGNIITTTNNHGGILGGISSGMPIVSSLAIKPTPSISKKQKTINFETNEIEEIEIKGRHDTCFARRVPPILEGCAAISILDSLLEGKVDNTKTVETYPIYKEEIKEENTTLDLESLDLSELRNEIDKVNLDILTSFEKRLDIVKKIGELKKELNLEITDEEREQQIYDSINENGRLEYVDCDIMLFNKIIELSKEVEKENELVLDSNDNFEIENNFNENIEEPILEEEITDEIVIEEEKETKPYGLLGLGIENSYSPKIHKIISSSTNNCYEYRLFDLAEDELEEFFNNRPFSGLNVTSPYKEKVIPYLDELTDIAESLHSVNVIYKVADKLIGDNTDYYGFIHSIKKNNVNVEKKNCLLLGNGGVSNTIAYALKNLGANDVIKLSHKDIDNKIQERFNDCEIVVNLTPFGKYPMRGESLVDLSKFYNLSFVMDLIYKPYRTNMLLNAKRLKVKYESGLDMLISQAIMTYEDFFNVRLDNDFKDELVLKIEREILKDVNFIFIGMPGVGKTVTGKLLAEKLGRDFYDTDEIISYRTEEKVEDIINNYGEKVFRDLEMDATTILNNKENAVISLGGGAVLRDENLFNLGENGIFINLKRNLNHLDTTGRPFSQNQSLMDLYFSRITKYNMFKDIEIDIENKDIDEIYNEILEKLVD